ncbi:unnamed protein product [Heligmosomoides polygyrus]|uniref:Uncharacterized protein n=1 Tax=Heligmosomoides polygyrus TaxID=6339 RepID=A0A183G8M8_HELPZ|nr:unnamed protein product [Heligmosomoides polygyrus]
MPRRGLHEKKGSEVLNEANMNKETTGNAATVKGLAQNFGKVSLVQRNDYICSKPPRPEPSRKEEAHHAAAQGYEERCDTRLLDRILKSIGIGWLSSSREQPLPSTIEEEERPEDELEGEEQRDVCVDYHGLDMFWEMDLNFRALDMEKGSVATPNQLGKGWITHPLKKATTLELRP